MRKARILLVLGVWMAILPFLGFPFSWKDVLTTLTGLGLIYLGYLIFLDYKKGEHKKETFDSFKENEDFNKN
jgi:hypothetical protein